MSARCACFSLCTDAEAAAWMDALPTSPLADDSPWHGYFRAVYGAEPPPSPLSEFSFWYHRHSGWPDGGEWPMAGCVRRGTPLMAGVWARDPRLPPCADISTCLRWLRPDLQLDLFSPFFTGSAVSSSATATAPSGGVSSRAPSGSGSGSGSGGGAAVHHLSSAPLGTRDATTWTPKPHISHQPCCAHRPRNAWERAWEARGQALLRRSADGGRASMRVEVYAGADGRQETSVASGVSERVGQGAQRKRFYAALANATSSSSSSSGGSTGPADADEGGSMSSPESTRSNSTLLDWRCADAHRAQLPAAERGLVAASSTLVGRPVATTTLASSALTVAAPSLASSAITMHSSPPPPPPSPHPPSPPPPSPPPQAAAVRRP